MHGWHAFRAGLGLSLRYWWLLLILYAVNVLSALLLAVLPALGLATWLGHLPVIREIADGVDAWWVIETLLSPITDTVTGAPPQSTGSAGYTLLLGLLTLAALPLLAWLPAAFLNGGVLLTYSDHPQKPCWRRFLWGCWHWFGAFLLWGAVQAIATAVVAVPLVSAAMAVTALAGRWLAWIFVPLLAPIGVAWVALMELTRVAAVTGETRHVFRAFGEAARMVFRHPLQVIALYGPALLLLGLPHGIYWALKPHLPLDWWPLVLLVQQGVVAIRLWARLVRLAGGTALLQSGERIRR